MGNEVTMSEALVVTLVSMSVVIVVLVLISLLIGLLKNMSTEKPKKQKEVVSTATIGKVDNTADNTETKPVAVTEDPQEDEEELIAVITAAIAASLGLNIPDINISSIRRTNQGTNIWREVSKQEHLYGKL
jgi:Na+-transporting methylmalonyl-CoA/oxaloacetate decarboxylase gamma subunit